MPGAIVLWMSKAVSRPTHAPRFRLLLPGILVEYVCSLFNGRMLDSFQDVDDGLESLEWHEAQRFDQLSALISSPNAKPSTPVRNTIAQVINRPCLLWERLH